MRVKEFLVARRAELRKFFELRFGLGWHTKIYRTLGGWMTIQPERLHRAEELARLNGFVPRDEQPRVQSLERNFVQRLRAIGERLNTMPAPICHSVTLGLILEEFFAHRPHRSKHNRKHKDSYSDVIPLDLLVFEGLEQRLKCPAFRALDSGHSWLTLPGGEPPGYPGPEGGRGTWSFWLRGSSEVWNLPRVWFRKYNGQDGE
jgi:hypothetical protein